MRLVCALVLLAGCSRLLGTSDAGGSSAPIKAYPDGEAGLKELWTDVLEAARKDDRGRVHDLLATTFMTDDDLKDLFGPERAAELAGRYHGLMATMINRGAIELVAQVYERKYDDVEVVPYTDAALAGALKMPVAMYSVRIKKGADALGLRYDFFVYRRGKWLTGNQLAKYLAK
jgi:hypothetical protein